MRELSMNLPDRQTIARDLEHELQESDHRRVLDSLEMTVVRAYFTAKGLHLAGDVAPAEETIGGWLRWVEESSKVG
jgi:hypothetical protein